MLTKADPGTPPARLFILMIRHGELGMTEKTRPAGVEEPLEAAQQERRAAEGVPSPVDGEAEVVLLEKVAKYWNQESLDRPDGRVMVTNRRLVFLAGSLVTGGKESLSFPLESIENLRIRRVMLVSPAIEFEAAGRKYVFTFFAGARRVADAINSARRLSGGLTGQTPDDVERGDDAERPVDDAQ